VALVRRPTPVLIRSRHASSSSKGGGGKGGKGKAGKARQHKSATRYATSKAKGDALELRVVAILKRLGHGNVRRSVFMNDRYGNRSEIDVVYGRWPFGPRYVECKHYSLGNTVPLSDIAKFKEVLSLLGIPARRGLFVTTSTYVPRALTTGIRTIDGTQLKAWERRSYAVMWWRRFRNAALLGMLGGAHYLLLVGDIGVIDAGISWYASSVDAALTQASGIANGQGQRLLSSVGDAARAVADAARWYADLFRAVR